MYCVSVNLTSAEWLEIQQATSNQWPTENLSRAEVVRRYAMLGIQFPKYVSRGDAARATERLQASQIAYTTSGCAIDPLPEGDHPAQIETRSPSKRIIERYKIEVKR